MAEDAGWIRGRTLELEGVHVRRGASTVLQGVNLRFEPGVRYVIVGASGSGKSTLLRLLNRLDDPDDGRLTLGGQPIRELPVRALRQSIGLVMQAPRPLPGTLLENLAYPHQVRGRPTPDRATLSQALEELGLDPGWLDREAQALSGGERQRLALATALGMNPEILALDEPTSALDPASARKVIEALASRTHRDGLRTIAVTHHREHASRLGDVVIRLEAGRVVDQGPADEVLARADATVWAETGEVAG
jgi:putative ABC transport system ATP-binding protein